MAEGWFKPSRKPTMRSAPAAVVTASAVVGYFAFPPVFWALLAFVFAVVLYKALFEKAEPLPKRGRELSISGGVLRQTDLGHAFAQIDVTQPFEYRILDRYDVANAVFRLYQRDDELTFYVSDPGGAEVVKKVVQVAWPPRSRHAGRSYPPTAV